MDQREIVFIDANIFLEIFLEDKRSKECEAIVERLRSNDVNAATSDFIVYACLIVLQSKSKSQQLMKEFILLINELRLEIIRPNLNTMWDAFDISEKYNLDFDDALVLSAMRKNSITNLLSLD